MWKVALCGSHDEVASQGRSSNAPGRRFCSLFYLFKKNDKSKISFFHDQFFFSFRAIQGVMETQPKMFCPTLIFPSLPSCKQAKAAKPSRSDFTPEPLQY